MSTVLAGCGTVGDLLGAETDAGPRTAEVVVLVPTAGKQADAGAGVLEAVRLAVGDSGLAAPGWSVDVIEVDDTGEPERAAEAAGEVAADERVAAVVGGLSAQVVRAVQPVLARASVPFVSPADDAPEHTRGADPASPLRPYESYFRTALTGGDPVAVAADYAVTGLGAERVAVVDGGSGPEADRFRAQVERLGAEIVAFGAAGRDDAGIDAVMTAAVSHQATVVYVAGDAELAGRVAKRLAGTGLAATLVGGASLRSEDFMAAAGTAADGAVAVVGPRVTTGRGQPAGDLTARLAAAGIDVPGPFAAAAYDAGTAVAQALSRCLRGEETAAHARAGCVAELEQVSFRGVTGEVTFDRYGDRTGAAPAVFEVREGAWREVGAT
ncbi:MAG TPA: ABC transporter substrate-binding protein [Jiangellaceae bacterium]|nr:ABC transporter substrate-binding protein [Jiangellaceae bacterium]